MDCRSPKFKASDEIQVWLTSLEAYINEPAVNKCVRQISYLATTITEDNKIAWLLKAISFLDLTSLNNDDTKSTVEQLCENAANPIKKLPFQWNKPLHTAAVCVYPSKIKDAINSLKKLKKMHVIKVASVAAGFPSGLFPLETRLQEVSYAIEYGADEIDVVIDRSLVLNHQWMILFQELFSICTLLPKTKERTVNLKVIISSGELFNLKDVYKATMVALFAGADFVKTSTGKDSVNATLQAGIVMCRAIKEFERLAGRKTGFKPAGGIKTAQDALEWMVLVKEELGNDWLTSNLFRIGASSLLQDISTEIIKTYENKSIQRPLEDSENEISERENNADEDSKDNNDEKDNKDKGDEENNKI
ncbi:Putative deoxyribose-phosphate aldolase [Trachymyrmex septentrionalis]|uniref:deoxyribose-phosphate aldolase n=1 Tax=Trachymyrmex septentrionalis TaxID=34720 RepID=A0A195F212_9HYME|nr:PREDICTED: deoxyribose-phosphate aldolase [Trachymyrmex septentrionalis]XP_018349373.1 PREDICTED: deoxyribose-phosphate aldolase [Trachymyrmex septentrionalis]XP_018349374.1 PREDICTED: deoxyribose-phosphate aldolase [Trachymyrmex septentrionalis]KYN34207.1 Putative deoxyribose-phosphate aldolase [Trachymyrmex septentrionalis]